MNKEVTIRLTKNGRHFEVIDLKTKKPWANELFPEYQDAKDFCKDNKLKLRQIYWNVVLEQKITDVDNEGEVMITEIVSHKDKKRNEADGGLVVQLISNCNDGLHKDFRSFVDRKIRITIETID